MSLKDVYVFSSEEIISVQFVQYFVRIIDIQNGFRKETCPKRDGRWPWTEIIHFSIATRVDCMAPAFFYIFH